MKKANHFSRSWLQICEKKCFSGFLFVPRRRCQLVSPLALTRPGNCPLPSVPAELSSSGLVSYLSVLNDLSVDSFLEGVGSSMTMALDSWEHSFCVPVYFLRPNLTHYTKRGYWGVLGNTLRGKKPMWLVREGAHYYLNGAKSSNTFVLRIRGRSDAFFFANFLLQIFPVLSRFSRSF